MRMSLDFGYEKPKYRRFFIYIALFVVLVAGVFVFINLKIRPFVISVTQGYAVNAVSNTLNDIIDEVLKKDEYSFVNIIKDSQGQIAAVMMNSTDVNLFMTQISIGMKEKIADMDEIEAKIPLGNFLPHPFFAGLGPDIPVRFLILANSNVGVEETFEARGINQTLYTLTLYSDTSVKLYIPTVNTSITIKNNIPVFQTLVVGGVPDSYTNVEGMDGTVQDTVLDIE